MIGEVAGSSSDLQEDSILGRIEEMQMTPETLVRLGLSIFAALGTLASPANGAGSTTAIDFETYPDGTDVVPCFYVSDQFACQGVVFEHTWTGRGLAGLILEEGMFGFQNYGNSPITAVEIGDYGETSTIRFVDPVTRLQRGVEFVSARLGDGDAANESFTITVYDTAGGVLHSEGATTSTNGYAFQYSTATAMIGSVAIQLDINSASGAGFDDLVFTAPVTDPLTLDFAPDDVGVGDSFTITAQRGVPGNLVALVLIRVDGAGPFFIPLVFGVFDPCGSFNLGGTLTSDPAVDDIVLRAIAIGPAGKLVSSNDETVHFK